MTMIDLLETALGRQAEKVFLPMQPGDVSSTYADTTRLAALCGYAAKVPLETGLERFVAWHRDHHGPGARN
jgi:UDP-glucuronate 4-epimerase